MDYTSEFKKYVTSHQTSLAVRVTFSVVLPPLVFFYLHAISVGAAMSIGALCTSLTDTPGPPQHRRNGFYACIALNGITSILIGLTNAWHLVLGGEIIIFSFLFGFITVYGARASSVGMMALLVLILTIDSRRSQSQVIENGLLIGLGGMWYALLSLVLYRIFPYRLAQQAVGESVISTARYLRIKGLFYHLGTTLEDAYAALMKEQVILQDQQEQVRELLFKTRRIVEDSTPKSRVLLMMFVDSVDLFELILSTQQNYTLLREQFDQDKILPKISVLIDMMAGELEDIGIAIQANAGYRKESTVPFLIREVEQLTKGHTSLEHILQNIKTIQERIYRLSLYTHYDEQISAGYNNGLDYDRFITHQPIDKQVFVDNLTFRSQVFRHAVRLSLAMWVGYIISRFLPFGHGYWILLSISVILKPIFGSTKRLYFQRLGGTLIGAALGGTILYFVTNGSVLLTIMLVSMIVGYSMQRRNYLVYSTFLTVFILIAFHFLYNNDFRVILMDRVVDTAIGSFIALLAGFVFIPSWSQETMRENMREMVRANQRYFYIVCSAYKGMAATLNDFKVARKGVFVALANLADNFQRILSEPKSKQKNVPFMHQFVVSNQMFAAHTASLAYYTHILPAASPPEDFEATFKEVTMYMDRARGMLGDPLDQLPVTAPSVVQPQTPGTALKSVSDQFEIIRTLSRDIAVSVERYEA